MAVLTLQGAGCDTEAPDEPLPEPDELVAFFDPLPSGRAVWCEDVPLSRCRGDGRVEAAATYGSGIGTTFVCMRGDAGSTSPGAGPIPSVGVLPDDLVLDSAYADASEDGYVYFTAWSDSVLTGVFARDSESTGFVPFSRRRVGAFSAILGCD